MKRSPITASGPSSAADTLAWCFAQETDTNDDRQVAIKVLLPEFSHNDEEMHRFVRGMKTAMPLKHPNLIRLYGTGRTGGFC